MDYNVQELNEHAIIIDLGHDISKKNLQTIQSITSYLESHPFQWIIEYVPAFTTITIYYDLIKVLKIAPPGTLPYHYVSNQVHILMKAIMTIEAAPTRRITIPVCYGGELGPDLQDVAKYNNLTSNEVIDIHSNGEYTVYMIGFAPGFPYLGGLSEKIFTPRKSTPRLKIPAGSVGIAGKQTGVYPIETPGGWQIIGRTPLALFRPTQSKPSLIHAGDIIKFVPITFREFNLWKDERK